jgi:putative ABC transport system permease protein
MLQDFRYSLRALAKHPSFALVAILVLGLAVGVNTAVFSLINSLLLRPLAVRAPDELGFMYHSNQRVLGISYASYQLLLQKTDVFSAIAAKGGDSGRLRRGNEVVPLQGEVVSANYFDVLGVAPRIGRRFDPKEESVSSAPVAIISEALWRSQFETDPNVVGRLLSIDSPEFSSRYSSWKDYTIVGVMPASFTGTGSPWQPSQYWLLVAQRAFDSVLRDAPGRPHPLLTRGVVPIGRRKAGVTIEQARAAVDVAGREIILQQPSDYISRNETYLLLDTPRLRLPFSGAYFFSVPRLAAALMAIATLLMVIAATNLAGMLLARGVGRRTEIAVRLSLGAGRARLVRQLLIESALLAAGGTMAGLALARLLIVAATREIPRQMPGMNATPLSVDVPLDGRALLFAGVTCFLTALVVGLAPAIAAVRTDLLSSLTSSGIVAPRQVRSRIRRLVLVPQIALSLVLLLVAGVMVRSLLRIELASPGYEPEHAIVVKTQLPFRSWVRTREEYAQEASSTREIIDRIVARVGSLPEVSSVAVTGETIQGAGLAESGTTIIARSDYGTTNTHRGVTAGYVSADYFKTMGIPLLRGRAFDTRDRHAPATATIVSERLANELWPGRDPIGEALAFHSADTRTPPRWIEVVGVAKSVTLPLDEYPRPVFYVPIESSPLDGTTLLVRGPGNPSQLIDRVKQAISQAERTAVVSQARPLTDVVEALRYPRRFSAALLGSSGLAALILATLGVFGLMSYTVAQRLGEIGVRMVLGAQRKDVIRLVLFDGAGVVSAGIVIGFALGFAAIRYASHAIVPLPDIDALTFMAVPALLIAVVLLACYIPARRAARVDPLVVLRMS